MRRLRSARALSVVAVLGVAAACSDGAETGSATDTAPASSPPPATAASTTGGPATTTERAPAARDVSATTDATAATTAPADTSPAGSQAGGASTGATAPTDTSGGSSPGTTANAPATTIAATATLPPGARGADCAGPLAADPALADGATELTVDELIAAIPELGRFAAALAASGTEPSEPGPRTVLAPIDSAFDELAPETAQLLETDPSGAGAAVVGLHVLAGDLPVEALLAAGHTPAASGGVNVVADGTAFTVDAGGGPATVVCSGLAAADGQLLLIDRVLLPAPVDTNAIGGSRLFRVDLTTGTADSPAGFGGEVGVLGVAVAPDGRLTALTDANVLLTVDPADPTQPLAEVPVTGIEGSTLLALDALPDGGHLAVTDFGGLTRIDDAGVATLVGELIVDDLGVGLDVDAAGGVQVVTATGTHVVAEAVDPAEIVPAEAPIPVFAADDAHAGSPARVVALASWDETIYAVEAVTGVLARLTPEGELSTIGSLGVTLTDGASLDIAEDGTAYLTVPG